MEALKWQPALTEPGDFVAYNDKRTRSYYVGLGPYTGRWFVSLPGFIPMNVQFDTAEQAMEACEAHFATNGGW